MTMLYFCLSALDVLGALQSTSVGVAACGVHCLYPVIWLATVLSPPHLYPLYFFPFLRACSVHDKGLTSSIIEWIYAQQVHPHIDLVTGEENVDGCGFRGGSSGGVPFEPNRVSDTHTHTHSLARDVAHSFRSVLRSRLAHCFCVACSVVLLLFGSRPWATLLPLSPPTTPTSP
jgi:hypothetical protein